MSATSSEVVAETGVVRAESERPDAGGRHRFCWHPSPMAVRYIYAALFLLANIFAWVVRESHVTFFEGQRHNGCHGDHDCLAADAVLVISHTCFLFFLVMFFSTVYTNKLQDRRNSWHSQWWPAKMLLLAGSVMISTFAPTYWIQFYGKVAPFGAGVFLFVQLLSLMRFITNLNKWCQTNFETWYRLAITVSIIAYICSTVGSIFMCFRYTGCWLNIAFIGTTLLLAHLMYLIPLIKSQTNGFYMEPGLVGAYIVFLCYSAIRSEPAETDCYKKEKASASADWKTIVSFVIELGSIAGAVFSTGKDYKCIQLRNVVESEDDVPYGYGFFHFVFAMGSMYFGMLFIGWDMHHIMDTFSMDVGWTSVWVHIVNEGLTVLSFVAILVARIYEIGWLRQLLARIFGIGSQQPPPPPPSSEMNILKVVITTTTPGRRHCRCHVRCRRPQRSSRKS